MAATQRKPVDLEAHRGSRYSIQIRDGILDPKHYQAMGDTIWLYLYLHKVCSQRTGFVKHYEHKEAAEALGLSVPTIERYLRRLRTGGYVTVTRGYNQLSIQITRYAWQEGRRGQATSNQNEPSDEMVYTDTEPSKVMDIHPSEPSLLMASSEERAISFDGENHQNSLARTIYTSSFNRDEEIETKKDTSTAPATPTLEDHDEHAKQAVELCTIMGIEMSPNGSAVKSMCKIIVEFADKAPRPLVVLALQCAEWCEVNGKKKRTTARFSNWIERAILWANQANQPAQSAAKPKSQPVSTPREEITPDRYLFHVRRGVEWYRYAHRIELEESSNAGLDEFGFKRGSPISIFAHEHELGRAVLAERPTPAGMFS